MSLDRLRQTRAYDDDDMIAMFTVCAEFADARENAEFLESIGEAAAAKVRL